MGKMIIGALSTVLTIAASLYLLKHTGEYLPTENKNVVFAIYGVAIASIVLALLFCVRLVVGKDQPEKE
jgi:hypothetical protein